MFGSKEQSEKVASLAEKDRKEFADENNFIEPKKLIALFGKAAKPNGDYEE